MKGDTMNEVHGYVLDAMVSDLAPGDVFFWGRGHSYRVMNAAPRPFYGATIRAERSDGAHVTLTVYGTVARVACGVTS